MSDKMYAVIQELRKENEELRKAMSEWMPNAVERLQGRAAWTAYYESDADKVNRLILDNAALQQAIRDQDANEHCIRELKAENAALRESLKQARRFASDNHTGEPVGRKVE